MCIPGTFNVGPFSCRYHWKVNACHWHKQEERTTFKVLRTLSSCFDQWSALDFLSARYWFCWYICARPQQAHFLIWDLFLGLQSALSPVSLFLRLAMSSGWSKWFLIWTRTSMFSTTSFYSSRRTVQRYRCVSGFIFPISTLGRQTKNWIILLWLKCP